MLTQQQTTQLAPASPAVQCSRLRRWAARRAQQFLWTVAILAVVLLVITAAVLVRRWSGLIGLPDIGDPFDVAAFRAFGVPKDQDAFVLIRQAEVKLSQVPALPPVVSQAQLRLAVGWSKADPKLRDFVAAHRELLKLFRRGAERPDAVIHTSDESGRRQTLLNLGLLVHMVLLEGSRLEEQGDMAGAWGWYRSVLLMKTHVMRRGSIFQRYDSELVTEGLNTRIASWVADRRTEVPLLRKALAEVLAHEPKADWDVFSLKLDYLDMMAELDTRNGRFETGNGEDLDHWIGGEKLPPNLAGLLHTVRRFVFNEPERSRRVLRLVFANWLAHAGHGQRQDCHGSVVATFRDKLSPSLSFYDEDPRAASGKKGLPPEDVAEWLFTTRDAAALLSFWEWPAIGVTEKRHYGNLVFLLAEELYRREHGAPPPSERALIGLYLDHLPDDGSAELDNGPARRVVVEGTNAGPVGPP